MNDKIEKQLNKIKALDAKMISNLEAMKIKKEEAANAKEEETLLNNLCSTIEREINVEKDKLFEMLRNEK